MLHNRHVVDFLQRVSFPGGVQSATSGTKDQDANFFIFATRHGFVTNYIAVVTRHRRPRHRNTLQTPAADNRLGSFFAATTAGRPSRRRGQSAPDLMLRLPAEAHLF
jgi:hypothetical protein